MASPIKKTLTYSEKNEEQRATFISAVATIPTETVVDVDKKRTSVIGFLCGTKHIAIEIYNHATDAQFFESWFENVLLKSTTPKSTIIMDNAGFHRKHVLKEIADKSNMKLLFCLLIHLI